MSHFHLTPVSLPLCFYQFQCISVSLPPYTCLISTTHTFLTPPALQPQARPHSGLTFNKFLSHSHFKPSSLPLHVCLTSTTQLSHSSNTPNPQRSHTCFTSTTLPPQACLTLPKPPPHTCLTPTPHLSHSPCTPTSNLSRYHPTLVSLPPADCSNI